MAHASRNIQPGLYANATLRDWIQLTKLPDGLTPGTLKQSHRSHNQIHERPTPTLFERFHETIGTSHLRTARHTRNRREKNSFFWSKKKKRRSCYNKWWCLMIRISKLITSLWSAPVTLACAVARSYYTHEQQVGSLPRARYSNHDCWMDGFV